jgi:hypothetical protein
VVEVPAPKLQEKEVIPTTEEQVITADEGNSGLSSIVVKAIQTEEKTAEINGEVIPADGKYLSKVTVNVQPVLQDKIITPTKASQEISADSNYHGLSSVTVNPIPDKYQDVSGVTTKASEVLKGSTFVDATGQAVTGTMTDWSKSPNIPGAPPFTGDIKLYPLGNGDNRYLTFNVLRGYHDGDTKVSVPSVKYFTVIPSKQDQYVQALDETSPTGRVYIEGVVVEPIPDEYIIPTDTTRLTGNGTYDVAAFAKATVDVQPDLQSKTVTPTKASQSITASSGYYGLERVTVEPIPDTFMEVPTDSISITSNGTHNVLNYASATVDVQPLFNIAYGETAPTDTSKLWIKLTKPETIPVIIVTPAGTTQQHLNTLVIEADVSKNTFQLLPNIELGVNSVYFENADGDRTEIGAALYKNNGWIEI